MENNFWNTEDIEKMLAPQCGFHASEGLRNKVLNEARVMSGKHRLRIVTWIAAACVAGILVIFLTPPKDSPPMATAINTPTTAKNTHASGNNTVAHVIQNRQPGSMTPEAAVVRAKEKHLTATAERKRTAARHAPRVCLQAVTVEQPTGQSIKATEDSSQVNGAVPIGGSGDNGQLAAAIPEADLPITCPENMEYTPEEIELLKRKARQAYLNWIKLEMEIASHNLKQTANIKNKNQI